MGGMNYAATSFGVNLQEIAHCKLIIANSTGPIEKHTIWFCCMQTIMVQTRWYRPI